MEKRCWNCANEKESTECFDCVFDCKKPSKWSAGENFVLDTNGDKIRAMSNTQLATEMLFFCPTDAVFGDNKPHYTGLDGKYYFTADEAFENSLKWLDMPAEDTL